MCPPGTSGSIWEVVGGVSNGGIVVRTGKDMESQEAAERLVTGSLVEEVERDDCRICYKLLSGIGPASGWVSTTFHGKSLLVQSTQLQEDMPLITDVQLGKVEVEDDKEEQQQDGDVEEYLVDPLVLYSLRMAAVDGEAPEDVIAHDFEATQQESKEQAKKAENDTSSSTSALIETPYAEPLKFKDGKFSRESVEKIGDTQDKAAPALRVSTGPTLGRQFKKAGKPIVGARPKLVSATEEAKSAVAPAVQKPDASKDVVQPQEAIIKVAQSSPDAKARPTPPCGTQTIFFSGPSKAAAVEKTLCREVDLDTGKLCRYCRLPVGDSCYFHESTRAWVHGECYAQLLMHDYMEGDEKRLEDEALLKRSRREEYCIGWKVDYIPRSIEPAAKLGCALVPQGLCCLVLDDELKSVLVAPTIEPAASLNLEYLSTALKVRRKDGREPLFSLDPLFDVDGRMSEKDMMQVKRFEPDWLAGTRVGEVLFQSDYHLKELSMGEYNQPVVGMKSACEYKSAGPAMDEDWSAREWFLVRDAKINMSADNVIVPYVKMGVEAREQVLERNGMVDAPLTRKDHPMVQYADAFTRNFDLIAERKSVVHSLRELAKASVVAKFLIDSQIKMEETWFNLAEDFHDCCSMEIPQLWNERLFSKIGVKDGEINFDDKDICPRLSGIYGGVEFGLERFTLTTADAPKVAAKLGGTMKAASTLPSAGKGRLLTQAGAPPPKISISARATGVPGAPAAVSVAASQVPASVQQMLSAAALSAPRRVAPARVRAAGPTQLRKMAPLDKAVPPARMALPLGLSASTVSTVGTTSTAPGRGVTPLIATGTPVSTVAAAGGVSLSGAPLVGRVGQAGAISALGAPRPGAFSTVAPRAPNVELTGATISGTPATASLSGLPGVMPSSQVAAPISALTGAARFAVPSASRYRMMAAGLSPGASLSGGAPQGVDLNLDQFNLTNVEFLPEEDSFLVQDTSFSIGASFFTGMGIEKGSASCFKEQDAELLRAVFNSNLSDRREEHDCFVPPDTRASYVNKLRKLVKQEDEVRAKRKEVFMSTAFAVGDAGPLFPPSWTSSFEISSRKADKGCNAAPSLLHPRSDYRDHAQQIMKSAKATFDKTTEDGMRFRIYRVGSLEVRTTQLHEESEEVCAVFSIRDSKSIGGNQLSRAQATERIEKVTEYVERPIAGGEHGFYVVVETEKGNVIVSEKSGAMLTWEENVADLEDRNSLAKVIRTGDCRNSNTTVWDLKKQRQQLASDVQSQIVGSGGSRLYAQDMFIAAMGGIQKVEDAYLQKEFDAATAARSCQGL